MTDSTSVAAGQVVTLHYTLTVDGNPVESSREGDSGPFDYLHGASNIVPGLEEAVAGKSVGDSLEVTVEPEKAYGKREEEAVQVVPRAQFPGDFTPQVGLQFFAQTPDGQQIPGVITALDDEKVTVDFNHPLAGATLHFAIEVMAIRPATSEEIEHGHPHGKGGCGHDHSAD